MDPDVVEIPPPTRMFKHKEVNLRDVIEIDDEDDSVGLMFFKEAVDNKNKGKAKMFTDGYNDRLVEKARVNLLGLSTVEGIGPMDGVESSKSFIAGMPNVINLDDHSSDASCDDDDDDFVDLVEDFMDVDDYAMLQAHFDNSDIPPGVEAPIPFLLNNRQSKKKVVPGSSSVHMTCPMQSDIIGFNGTNPSLPSSLTDTTHFSLMSSYSSSSSLPAPMDDANQPTVVDSSPPRLSSQSVQSKKKVANLLQHKGASGGPPLGVLSKSRWRRHFQGRKKQLNLSSSANYDSASQSNALKLPSVLGSSFWEPYIPDNVKQIGAYSSHSSSFSAPGVGPGVANHPPGVGPGIANHPAGVGQSFAWPSSPFKSDDLKLSLFGGDYHSSFDPWGPVNYSPETAHGLWENFHHTSNSNPAASSANSVQAIAVVDKAEVLRKFQLFKQFDTVDDYSDHQYKGSGSSLKHSEKTWVKRIQDEWKILKKDLPDTIFVRVYESRMDILRAVIVGAEGTPYHDGLFFFDVFFPNNYPSVPPLVHYHSGGLRLNPNLYNNGKVCLSLLNTWTGNKNEKWIPGTSTMLQVLVSIQGLILNAKPYFNEPGYAHMSGSASGEKKSLQYNESTFILSLKTMTYSIKRPPKHFEDLVMGHFLNQGHDILVACKAYMDGAQVGCLVKGGVQDVDEGDKSCSKQFKESLIDFMHTLVNEFSRIGVEGCEKFRPPAANANGLAGSASQTAPRTPWIW